MRRVVFVGNCQLQTLADLYRKFSDRTGEEQISHLPSYEQLTDARVRMLEEADIIIEQRLDFPPQAEIDSIASRAERQLIPLLGGAFVWPFAGSRHPRNDSHWFLPHGPYDAELGDSYLNRLITSGMPPADAVEQYLALDVTRVRNLDRLFEIVIERQRARDTACGYKFADFIAERFREEPMFRTPHHPDLGLTLRFAAQFFQRIGAAPTAIGRLREQLRVSPFPKSQLPIHPAVAAHFQLRYAGPESRYNLRNEGCFTFAEYAFRYMTYDWNPDLAEGIALAVRDPEQALAKLEAGLEHSPESGEGWFNCAETLRRLGRPGDAELAARRAVAVDPTEGRYQYGLASALAELDRLDEAAQTGEQAVMLEPANSYILSWVANLALRRGQLADAESLTRRALSLASDDAHLHHFLGIVLARQGRFPEAAEAQLAAGALAPDVPGVHFALSQTLARSGRVAEALDAARRAASLEPESTPIAEHLRDLLTLAGEPDDRANSRQAAPLAPPETAPLSQPGIVGRQDSGGVAVPPDAQHQIRLAAEQIQAGRPTDAEATLQAVIALAPDSVGAYDLLANVTARLGRKTESIAAARRAADLTPGDIGRQQRVARAMIEAGEFAAAEQVLHDLGPFETKTLASHQHHLLGIALRQLGRLEEALTEARQANELEPDDPDRLARLASLLLATNHIDEADRVVQTALVAHPQFVPLQHVLQSILALRSGATAADQQRPQAPSASGHNFTAMALGAARPASLRFLLTGAGRGR